MIVRRTGICDGSNHVENSVAGAINGDNAIICGISCLHGVGAFSNINSASVSDDLTANSFCIKCKCCVGLAGCCVVIITVNGRISNCNYCACSGYVYCAKTIKDRIFNCYNCICCRSCNVYSVVSCGCGNVFNSNVGCALNYVDCTLALSINCEILNCYAVCSANIDSTSCGRSKLESVTI